MIGIVVVLWRSRKFTAGSSPSSSPSKFENQTGLPARLLRSSKNPRLENSGLEVPNQPHHPIMHPLTSIRPPPRDSRRSCNATAQATTPPPKSKAYSTRKTLPFVLFPLLTFFRLPSPTTAQFSNLPSIPECSNACSQISCLNTLDTAIPTFSDDFKSCGCSSPAVISAAKQCGTMTCAGTRDAGAGGVFVLTMEMSASNEEGTYEGLCASEPLPGTAKILLAAAQTQARRNDFTNSRGSLLFPSPFPNSTTTTTSNTVLPSVTNSPISSPVSSPDFTNTKDSSPQSTDTTGTSSTVPTVFIILGVVGALVVILLSIWTYYCCSRRRREPTLPYKGPVVFGTSMSTMANIPGQMPLPATFPPPVQVPGQTPVSTPGVSQDERERIVIHAHDPTMPDEVRLTPGQPVIVLETYPDQWARMFVPTTKQM
ncbi:hypothetical protein HK102_008569, partial [Quaeritorhiza haematococci]